MRTEINKKLNIISFNIPYPADYGGVIDVFYKIKYLHRIGVEIILHTFEYGREHSEILNKYCSKVYYYKRKTGIISQLSLLPYIVKSRENKELLNNLQQNDYPILFEGLHTCFYLDHPTLAHRNKILRAHNIEHEYYRGLMNVETSWWKKMYFYIESVRLKRFEKIIYKADYIGALSTTEELYFRSGFGRDKVFLLPIFHQADKVDIKSKIVQPYLLFHGDLSVIDNVYAAYYLIEKVASKDKNLKLIIAGKNPDTKLKDKISEYSNVILIPNPDKESMDKLVRNASINILYVKQPAGVKLKLLASLFNGRYCMANEAMVKGSGLENLCIPLSDNTDELLKTVHTYYEKDMDALEIEKRKKILEIYYSNEKNAMKIASFL